MSEIINVLELRSVRGTGGGPEKTILLGTERTDRDRFSVTVCYIRDLRDQVFGIDRRAGRHQIEYVEIRERHSLDPAIWRPLTQLIRERSVDIVHAHEYKTDLLALLLGRRTGVVPMATAHGWTGQSPRERLLYYPVDKKLLARFPCVIAVSSDIKNELVRYGADGDRVTVVLNAIDPVMFRRRDGIRERVRAELEMPAEATVIGAVGRVEAQKRFDILIDAFAQVRRNCASARLVIAGEGSLRSSLSEQAKALGLQDVCAFLGHREDVADLHHGFDLFVQSSEYEGTPNAVLEAMALETPIVATDVGGSSELAFSGVHASIVPPRDVTALATAIDEALSNPEQARQRATAARSRVETDLSFDARTRRLEQIYVELMASCGSRSRRVAIA